MRDRTGELTQYGNAHQMRNLLALQCGFLLRAPPVGDVVGTADIAEKCSVRIKPRYALIEHPAIFAVVASQAILHFEFPSPVERFRVGCAASFDVIQMHSIDPAVADFLAQRSAGEFEP